MHVYASRLGRVLAVVTLAVVTLAAAPLASAAPPPRKIGVNVVLATDVSAAALARLSEHGTVRDVLPSIRGVTLQAVETELPAIQALPFVESAEPDVVHAGSPIDTVPVESLGGGGNMWNLDAANLTELGAGRTVSYDGSGVWVAVVDSGLLDSWRQYFPQERIATQFAISFGGGGGNVGTVSTQPNKWQHDQASHGTAVTSAILGFRDEVGRTWNGAAPRATVIPVKVLNQTNTAHASVIARGITYVADLKKSRALGDAPVVLNLSVGGGPSALERAAVQYAIDSGIVFVASAGNFGTTTMTYPAAYPEVISVGASGWVGQWGAGAGGTSTTSPILRRRRTSSSRRSRAVRARLPRSSSTCSRRGSGSSRRGR